MGAIEKARLMLTKCGKCLGCERLNDDSFRGDDKCLQFRQGARNLEDLKPVYNSTLERINKAIKFMDGDAPIEKKEKWYPEFKNLKKEMTNLIVEISAAGHRMTAEEMLEGFK